MIDASPSSATSACTNIFLQCPPSIAEIGKHFDNSPDPPNGVRRLDWGYLPDVLILNIGLNVVGKRFPDRQSVSAYASASGRGVASLCLPLIPFVQVRVPEALKGAAAQTVVQQLLRKDLVEEVPASGELPVWRHDDDEAAISLLITGEGLAALGIVSETAATVEPSPAAAPTAVDAVAPAALEEKVGSKRMQLISLLRQSGGASLDDIVSELGWLPHTTRAALTGLRKRGFTLERRRSDDGRTFYEITAEPPALASAAGQEAAAAEGSAA